METIVSKLIDKLKSETTSKQQEFPFSIYGVVYVLHLSSHFNDGDASWEVYIAEPHTKPKHNEEYDDDNDITPAYDVVDNQHFSNYHNARIYYYQCLQHLQASGLVRESLVNKIRKLM